MKKGNTMVATLLSVVIILILMVALFKGSGMFGKNGQPVSSRPDGHGTTVLGAAEYAAKDDVCKSNLDQVRSGIQVYETSNDDHPPESLQDTKLGSQFYACPIGHEPYAYDPTTGKVHCVHPGHESF